MQAIAAATFGLLAVPPPSLVPNRCRGISPRCTAAAAGPRPRAAATMGPHPRRAAANDDKHAVLASSHHVFLARTAHLHPEPVPNPASPPHVLSARSRAASSRLASPRRKPSHLYRPVNRIDLLLLCRLIFLSDSTPASSPRRSPSTATGLLAQLSSTTLSPHPPPLQNPLDLPLLR